MKSVSTFVTCSAVWIMGLATLDARASVVLDATLTPSTAAVSTVQYGSGNLTPGRVSNIARGGFTFTGASSTVGRFLSVSQFSVNSTFGDLTIAKLPSSTFGYAGDGSNVPIGLRLNIEQELVTLGANYRELLAARFNVPLSVIPFAPARIPFEPYSLGVSFAVEQTNYSYSRPSFVPTSGTLSFDAVWQENDMPGFHSATLTGFGGTYTFQSGVNHVVLSSNRPTNLIFNISNSDSLGGPSTLTISNMKFTAEYADPPTILNTSSIYGVEFYVAAAVPEPETAVLFLTGILAVAAASARRSRA